MIATVTMNPAVDYTVSLENALHHGEVNRTFHERITAGGKGVNVSLVLRQLGVPTTVYGYLSGTTGTMIAEQLQRTQIPTDWIHVPNQMNRINLKIREEKEVTELNGQGVCVSEEDTAALVQKLSQYDANDFIVLAGSIPSGAVTTHYADIIGQLAETGARFAVDVAGEPLRAVLAMHPFVVKPNLPELCDLFNVNIETWWDALPYGKELIRMGAENALVSLGADGALLFTSEERVWHLAAPHGDVKNAVGSGDSMLGGFLAACSQGKELTEALRMGIAAGSATAFSEWIADRSRIENILRKLPEPTELL
ncbi:MAG: 1-phosphofructokinase [Oscillospiraceae bacterium]|nr:1-phosphofructokinase [Oscillospiraceae bacterium]